MTTYAIIGERTTAIHSKRRMTRFFSTLSSYQRIRHVPALVAHQKPCPVSNLTKYHRPVNTCPTNTSDVIAASHAGGA